MNQNIQKTPYAWWTDWLAEWMKDERYQVAFEKLCDEKPEKENEILVAIRLAKFASVDAPQLAELATKAIDDRRELSRAFATINAYLEKTDPAKTTRVGEDAEMHLFNLGSIQRFTTLILNNTDKVASVTVSTSQKTIKPEIMFAVILSRKLKHIIGRPAFSEVAAIASVVHATSEEVSIDAVSKAVRRDKDRRLAN